MKRTKCEKVVERIVEGQEAGTAAEMMREYIRTSVRGLFLAVLDGEVEALCGAIYRPGGAGGCYRAGSAPGLVIHEGRRVDLVRPRVRRKEGFENSEVPLKSYKTAQDRGELHARLMEALKCGVSGRDQERLHGEGTPGTGKSEVSRLWITAGTRLLAEFRGRSIERGDWLCLMLDGVRLSGDQMAIVALGISSEGRKTLLDFEIGATENTETAKALLERLKARKFAPMTGSRLLTVLDGSAALENAVKAYWPDAVMQRCLVHKERNLRGYLPKRYWGELAGLFKRLRQAQGYAAAKGELAALAKFLESKNAAARASLSEAGESLIAFQKLGVTAKLNGTFLSTNVIENPFCNTRRKINRVTRWRAETDQASRWMAYALTEVEPGFRRIRNFEDLPQLSEALKRKESEVSK